MGDSGFSEILEGLKGSKEHWAWWRDDTCFMELNRGYIYNVLISCAHMAVEFVTL